ncbi:MAG: RNA polymerase subunit sigma-70 [Sphingobium sp.]|jgi:RNA polymerase sigma-70 factor (ECF subfamily)|nr:MAG: RNA polymerase subunit sigma-70 [Sphingobium sp.]
MASGLEAVFLDNRAALLRFLRARGAGDAAEDVLQDMWVRLSAKDVGPVADPLPYLYRAANNLMLDRYRSTTRREKREQDWTDGTTGALDDQPPTDAPADEQLIARERLAEAEAVLRALGSRVETVFRRFRVDGESQRGIAEDLGVSLTTVEKDLQKAYRAMVALKQKFDAE